VTGSATLSGRFSVMRLASPAWPPHSSIALSRLSMEANYKHLFINVNSCLWTIYTNVYTVRRWDSEKT
jgi:hypothetical protein